MSPDRRPLRRGKQRTLCRRAWSFGQSGGAVLAPAASVGPAMCPSALTPSDSSRLQISSWRLREEVSAYGAGWWGRPLGRRRRSPNPPTVAETTRLRPRRLLPAAGGTCHRVIGLLMWCEVSWWCWRAWEGPKPGIFQGHLCFFSPSAPAKAAAAPRRCHTCCLQGLRLHSPVKTSGW